MNGELEFVKSGWGMSIRTPDEVEPCPADHDIRYDVCQPFHTERHWMRVCHQYHDMASTWPHDTENRYLCPLDTHCVGTVQENVPDVNGGRYRHIMKITCELNPPKPAPAPRRKKNPWRRVFGGASSSRQPSSSTPASRHGDTRAIISAFRDSHGR